MGPGLRERASLTRFPTETVGILRLFGGFHTNIPFRYLFGTAREFSTIAGSCYQGTPWSVPMPGPKRTAFKNNRSIPGYQPRCVGFEAKRITCPRP